MIACLLVLPTHAHAASQSDLTFKLNSDGKSYAVAGCYIYASGSLTIPASYNGKPVTVIGKDAFRYCEKLTSVTLPNTITTISYNAFGYCHGLTSVNIPNSVTTIESKAFDYCTSLTSVTIPSSVTTIGDGAFYRAYPTGIWVDSGNKHYSSDKYGVLFDKDKTELICYPGNCVQKAYSIPSSVTTICNSAFSYSHVTSVTIPGSVTTIEGSAFANSDINSVTIPDSVTTLGRDAFYRCSKLTSATIGNGVKVIGDQTFLNCNSLVSVTLGGRVTTIEESAFFECTKLSSVMIPDSVVSLGNSVFKSCTSLRSVKIPNSVTAVGGNAFLGCTSLTSVTLSDSISTISSNMFSGCAKLSSVTIPNSVKTIDSYAFAGCENLATMTIPNSVETIGEHAFADCSKLKSVTIPGSIEVIGDGAFYSCGELLSVTIGNGVTTIGDSAFADCDGLISITIPDSVKKIGESVLKDCTGLRSATIGNGVAKIDDFVFADCSNLEFVVLGNSVTTIGMEAFFWCESLRYIVVPNSLAFVDEGAFSRCDRFTDVYYKGTQAQWNQITVVEDGNGYLTRAKLHFAQYAKITRQPKNVYASNGTKATITLAATGDGLTYTWYFKDPGKTEFSKSSITTDTYSTTMNSWRSGRQVYCVVTDLYGNSVTSDVATLLMGNTAKITVQPKSVYAANGAQAKTTLSATGDGLTYTWYFKNAGSSSWSKSSLAGNSYYVTMKSTTKGRQVYCVVKDKYGNSVKSNTVTLNMGNPATITKQPTNAAAASGKKITVKISATGDGLTYTWYYKNKGASSYSKSSITTNTYSVTSKTAVNGRQVYCVVKDKYGNSVKTNVVTLYKGNPAKITTQPKTVTVANGKQAKTTVKASGDGLKYTWYFKNVGSNTWSKSSLTGNSYYVTMKSTTKNRQVYCVVTDKYGTSVQSNVVTLKMK